MAHYDKWLITTAPWDYWPHMAPSSTDQTSDPLHHPGISSPTWYRHLLGKHVTHFNSPLFPVFTGPTRHRSPLGNQAAHYNSTQGILDTHGAVFHWTVDKPLTHYVSTQGLLAPHGTIFHWANKWPITTAPRDYCPHMVPYSTGQIDNPLHQLSGITVPT